MSDLSAKFAELEEQLATQNATMAGYVDTVETKLQSILDNLDTVITNNSANAQAIIQAISTASPCNDCTTTPIMGTPPITDTSPVDEEHCQRVQALLAVIRLMCDYADAAGDVSSIFTTSYLNTALAEIRATVDDSGIPALGWIDAITIAADGVNFIINRALFGGGARETFDALYSTLQSELYASDSPSAAKGVYDGIIDGSGGLAASRPLLKGFGYSDLFNYFLDSSTTPNLEPYNGLLCSVPEGCIFIFSQPVEATDASYPELLHRQMIVIPDWPHYGFTFAGTFFDVGVVHNSGPTGGTITQLSGGDCRIVYNDGSNHSVPLVIGVPFTIATGNDSFFIDDVTPSLTLSGEFTITYCPPPS